MELNKKIKLFMGWIFILAILYLVFNYSIFSYGSLTPLKAHKSSEKSYHYGPSEIVKEIHYENTKVYLCKYKNWFSLDGVYKKNIKWYPFILGIEEINNNESITYNFSNNKINNIELNFLYGIVNDFDIKKLILEVSISNELKKLEYYIDNNMFIFNLGDYVDKISLHTIKGFDEQNQLVYIHNFNN